MDGAPRSAVHELTGLTIGDSVGVIGNGAFSGCTSLTSVTILNNVTVIGSSGFWRCRSLTNIAIGKGVTSIGSGTFDGCTNLSVITVDTLNSVYSSLDGVLLNKSQTSLIQYPAGKSGDYVIPNTVTRIGNGAFHDCIGLISVTIPTSLTIIGSSAFSGCISLRVVFFKGDAPNPGQGMFDASSKAVVYYLPGTFGWSSTFGGGFEDPFGGRPAVLWNLQVQASAANFGVRTNRFGFNVTGTGVTVVLVEACTNLGNAVWSPVRTNMLSGGVSYFSDPQWTNHPVRFYRLRRP